MNEHRRSDDDHDLDAILRDGLRESVDGVGRLDATALAARLRTRRGAEVARSVTRDRRLRFTAIAAAAALVALLAGSGYWLVNRDTDQSQEVVATDPALAEGPFAAYEPGWHEIDTAGVPPMDSATLAWTGTELVVAGSVPAGEPGARAFAFDPARRTWRQLPDPPVSQPTIISAGDVVVAVGVPSEVAVADPQPVWATLDGLGSDNPAWTLHGPAASSPELSAAGAQGPTVQNGMANLLWTGERVIDMTHGAVLDPGTGTSSPAEMPTDIVKFSHLISSNAVWTGSEVVLAAWSDGDGLTWDERGALLGTIGGLPVSEGADTNYVHESTAVAVDGDVVLFDRDPSSRSVEFDPGSDSWSLLPDRPTSPENFHCPALAADVGALVVESCAAPDDDQPPPLILESDNTWTQLEAPPWNTPCCASTWLGTDEALFTWSSSTDTMNDPDAPNIRGAIWIPGGTDRTAPAPNPRSGAGPSDQPVPGLAEGCGLELMTDLSTAVPQRLAVGPTAGIGGVTDDPSLCSRYWGISDAGTHITQRPGPSLFSLSDEAGSGEYRWGGIEDGYGLEYTGSPEWSVVAYGLSESEFDDMVGVLLADTDRTVQVQLGRPDPTQVPEGSAVTSITGSKENGRDVITFTFQGFPAGWVTVSQSEQATTNECSPLDTTARWYLNIALSEASQEPQASNPYQTMPLTGAGLDEFTNSNTACTMGPTQLLANLGIDGPRPMTVESSASDQTIRIVLD